MKHKGRYVSLLTGAASWNARLVWPFSPSEPGSADQDQALQAALPEAMTGAHKRYLIADCPKTAPKQFL